MTLWEYRAELDRAVDGDTLDLKVDLGFSIHNHIRVRLADVDTAEIYGVKKDSDEYQRGIEHKNFVEEWFEDKDQLTVRTEKDRTGKYGRYIARVYADAECLNDRLIEEFDVASEG